MLSIWSGPKFVVWKWVKESNSIEFVCKNSIKCYGKKRKCWLPVFSPTCISSIALCLRVVTTWDGL